MNGYNNNNDGGDDGDGGLDLSDVNWEDEEEGEWDAGTNLVLI